MSTKITDRAEALRVRSEEHANRARELEEELDEIRSLGAFSVVHEHALELELEAHALAATHARVMYDLVTT